MRKIIIILLIATISCNVPKTDIPITTVINTQKCDSLEKIYDSLVVVLKVDVDSLLASNKLLRSKLNATYDSNKVYRATQKELNRFMDICIKDPSQLVFLKGWYLRAERIK